MKKIKNRFLTLIIIGLVFVLWNVLVFTIADLKNVKGNFWCSYAFITLAFLALAGITFSFKLSNNVIFSTITPSIIFSYVYFAISFVMNTIIMIFFSEKESVKACIILNIILLILFIIVEIVGYMGFSHIKEDQQKTDAKVKNLRTLSVKVGALEYMTNDITVKREITKLKEAISYSDPMGTADTVDSENEIENKIEVIKICLAENCDTEKVLSAIKDTMSALNVRNELLRSVK